MTCSNMRTSANCHKRRDVSWKISLWLIKQRLENHSFHQRTADAHDVHMSNQFMKYPPLVLRVLRSGLHP